MHIYLWALIMRITELLEGKNFKDLDFVRTEDGTTKIDYDLAEDLAFFIKNDDDVYRRHTHHAVHKCLENLKHKKKTSPAVFKDAAMEGYKQYVKQFPIRQLPDDLEDDVCNEVCKLMHEEICKHVEEGKYKD